MEKWSNRSAVCWSGRLGGRVEKETKKSKKVKEKVTSERNSWRLEDFTAKSWADSLLLNRNLLGFSFENNDKKNETFCIFIITHKHTQTSMYVCRSEICTEIVSTVPRYGIMANDVRLVNHYYWVGSSILTACLMQNSTLINLTWLHMSKITQQELTCRPINYLT